MKIGLASDLHLDFDDNLPGAFYNWRGDLLILAGDICEARWWNTSHMQRILSRISEMAAHVLIIMGNHEHYGSDFGHTAAVCRAAIGDHQNMQLLDNETVTIGGIQFIGSTLWTDYDGHDPVVKLHASNFMNDHKMIVKGDGRFTPEHAEGEFIRSRDYIQAVLKNGKPSIVITHHAPSWKSVTPRFIGNKINGAFVNNLDRMILDNENITHWCHGHTHSFFDYKIGQTDILCNPRGYPMERPQHLPEYEPITLTLT